MNTETVIAMRIAVLENHRMAMLRELRKLPVVASDDLTTAYELLQQSFDFVYRTEMQALNMVQESAAQADEGDCSHAKEKTIAADK